MASILVVDDEEMVREMVVRLLIMAGYTVSEACDGLMAEEKLRGETPDLVLTDICMPGMDGIRLRKLVQTRFPGVPCIAMSATEDEGGFDGFIRKPFDVHRLLEVVKNILEHCLQSGQGDSPIKGRKEL